MLVVSLSLSKLKRGQLRGPYRKESKACDSSRTSLSHIPKVVKVSVIKLLFHFLVANDALVGGILAEEALKASPSSKQAASLAPTGFKVLQPQGTDKWPLSQSLSHLA